MTNYNITELDISKKKFTHLPEDINKYTKLKKLNCFNKSNNSVR